MDVNAIVLRIGTAGQSNGEKRRVSHCACGHDLQLHSSPAWQRRLPIPYVARFTRAWAKTI
jgi:hypothetical protein